MRESYIEGKVKLWARLHGVLYLKISPMATAGYPDGLFLFGGRVCFIEFKAPGKLARPLQEARIAELRNHGFAVEVIDDIQSGINFLTEALAFMV